jgi:hypothetical protein
MAFKKKVGTGKPEDLETKPKIKMTSGVKFSRVLIEEKLSRKEEISADLWAAAFGFFQDREYGVAVGSLVSRLLAFQDREAEKFLSQVGEEGTDADLEVRMISYIWKNDPCDVCKSFLSHLENNHKTQTDLDEELVLLKQLLSQSKEERVGKQSEAKELLAQIVVDGKWGKPSHKEEIRQLVARVFSYSVDEPETEALILLHKHVWQLLEEKKINSYKLEWLVRANDEGFRFSSSDKYSVKLTPTQENQLMALEAVLALQAGEHIDMARELPDTPKKVVQMLGEE